MSQPGSAARLARLRHPDEEIRYRAVLELDPAAPDERGELFLRLEDESWRVRTAAVERLAALDDREQLVPGLLTELETGATVGGREAAAAALVRVGAPAVTALVARLGGEGGGLELAVLTILGDIGERRAAPALAARLADQDANVRSAAAEALGKVGGPEAAAALLAAIESDDQVLQATALEALCLLGLAPPCQRLVRLLASPANKRAGYRSLGVSDDPTAAALLAAGLVEPGRSAREAALVAIGQQRARLTPAGLARLAGAVRAVAEDPRVAAGCLEALGSEEPFAPDGALAVLAWLGEARHAPAMVRLAEDDRYRPLVEEALEALPRGAELLATLAGTLPGLTPLARLTVQGALAAAGEVTALHALAQAASDADPQVQAEAIATLGRLGNPRAVPSLGGLLGDDAPAVSGVAASALIRVARHSEAGRSAVLLECRARAAAAPAAALLRILGAVGEGEDLRLVRRGLAEGTVVRRVAAAAALAGLARRGLLRGEPVPELVAALRDPAWPVRAAAARALVDLGQAAAVPTGARGQASFQAAAVEALLAVVDDPEPAVRAAAVEALGAAGKAAQVPRIAAVVADPAAPAMVVLAALHALAQLGAATAAVLERGLGHPDAEVAKEAVAAAARLEGPEGGRLLLLAAASERWDVRHAAARAMAERGDLSLRAEAARRAAGDPDPMVARAFAEAARVLGATPGR